MDFVLNVTVSMQKRYRAAMSSYYRGAQGIVLTYSVGDRKSFEVYNLHLK